MKKPKIHLICNAHLDPVWQWRWDEGCSEAISTFRNAVEIIHENNPHHGKNASHLVTITSHGAGPLVRAQASAFNDLAAFDEAAEAIELQLRKKHERSKQINRDTLRKRKAI